MSTYYNGNGGRIVIDSESKGEEINALSGYTYTSRFGLSTAYADVIQQAKDAWMSAQRGDQRIIPLVIHTDQHGMLTTDNSLFQFLDHIVTWESVSAVCNLGDTVASFYSSNASQDLVKNTELEAAVKCMSFVPLEKQINVWGNHDYWLDNGGWLTDRSILEKYFRSGNAHKPNREGCYTVIDPKWNVKYMILSGYQGDASLYADTTYSTYYLQSYIVDWMIKELSKTDGYDVVILSHNRPSCGQGSTKYNPVTEQTSDGMLSAAEILSVGNLLYTFDALWTARKAKTSGTIIDRQGQSHTFDFSGCNSDLLCALHGHNHEDSVWYDATSGLLEAGFDYYLGSTTRAKSFHFVLIDRAENKLKTWKVSAAVGSDAPAIAAWETALTGAANGS